MCDKFISCEKLLTYICTKIGVTEKEVSEMFIKGVELNKTSFEIRKYLFDDISFYDSFIVELENLGLEKEKICDLLKISTNDIKNNVLNSSDKTEEECWDIFKRDLFISKNKLSFYFNVREGKKIRNTLMKHLYDNMDISYSSIGDLFKCSTRSVRDYISE